MGLVLSVSSVCATFTALVIGGIVAVYKGDNYYSMYMDLFGIKVYPGYRSCKAVPKIKTVTDHYIDQYSQGMFSDSEEVEKRKKLLGGMLGFTNAAHLAACPEEDTDRVSGSFLTSMPIFSD